MHSRNQCFLAGSRHGHVAVEDHAVADARAVARRDDVTERRSMP
jgi:hypothetical protein